MTKRAPAGPQRVFWASVACRSAGTSMSGGPSPASSTHRCSPWRGEASPRRRVCRCMCRMGVCTTRRPSSLRRALCALYRIGLAGSTIPLSGGAGPGELPGEVMGDDHCKEKAEAVFFIRSRSAAHLGARNKTTEPVQATSLLLLLLLLLLRLCACCYPRRCRGTQRHSPLIHCLGLRTWFCSKKQYRPQRLLLRLPAGTQADVLIPGP